MKNTLKNRIISGLLAGLMCISNLNMPVSAADFVWEQAENETGSEEITSMDAAAGAEEDSYTENESGAEEEDVSIEDGTSIPQEEESDQIIEQESAGEDEETAVQDLEEAAGNETAGQVVTGTFQISGTVTFHENLGGTDWSSLLRPSEFDQPIMITQTYTDSHGEEKTVTYEAQDHLSQDDFYLKFVHDGTGAGDFTIENVPKSVTDEYGVECQVTSYSVNIEPTLPYYRSDTPISVPITDPSNITQTVGTLTLNLKTQTLKLTPTVIPESTEKPFFEMESTYRNSQITGDTNRTIQISYKPTENAAAAVEVPVGISYEITQKATDGYRFDNNYNITTSWTDASGNVQTSTAKSENKASGTIEEGTNVEISTVNYAQNVSVGFDVKWLDNNSATRPSLSADNFVLQYRTGDGQWKDLTEEDLQKLGISEVPELDTSKAALNQYSYNGLPAVDADGKALQYQVLVKNNPRGYVSTYTDPANTNRREFVMEEQTDFSAQIVWRDLHKEENDRPGSIDSLRLYRRAENGTYELVYDKLPEGAVKGNSDTDTWTVNISDLPRYNGENQEYDYVLVQGAIAEDGSVEQATLESYKTYYDNGTGNFGNDVALCHNGGTITEVLHDTVDVTAKKIWKDPNGTEDRPNATVTLWRYVKGTADSIDDAYEKGLAAKVVFQTTDQNGNDSENVVSYQLDKAANSQDIAFTSQTVSDMPVGYEFPAYDDHGREYIYFVRESLSGEHADEYEIQYTTSEETYQNGTPAGGTITNVRRKKEAVAITKIWQNPAGLTEIEGASVQVEIKASTDSGKNYDTLTVYSDVSNSYDVLSGADKKEAQTITGFTSTIAQGEVIYYVNTYNSDGKPYDMANAQIVETVTLNGVTYTTTTDEQGNTIVKIGDQTYMVSSSYEGSAVLGNDMQQYRYKQTNTITELREYQLIKKWDTSISDDEMADITAVNFKLERRTTKDQADGTASPYESVLNADGSNNWTVKRADGRTWSETITGLPRYDKEGYEYYYRATEISFTDNNGNTITTGEASKKDKWAGEHYRTPDQTTVVNRKYGEDGGFFTVSKIWQDNGDTENRKKVQIRVYRRSELKKELEEAQKNSEDVVDLDALKTKYVQQTITSQNQYTTTVYYKDLEKSIDGKEWENPSSDSWSNYIVLEYCVGEEADGAEAAQYTYGQLLQAAGSADVYDLSGTVANNLRQYKTQTSFENGYGRLVLLTNTRIGTTTIKAEKTWQDENNASGHRPVSVQFQLYRDGSPYTQISDEVAVSTDLDDKSYTVELDKKTGIITVNDTSENTKGTWNFTINGLPMFSATAVPYTYDLDELVITQENENVTYRYIQKKSDPVVEDKSKTQTYTFAFTNTITGTTSHVAYKYWKDKSTGAGNRPDLYMNLYQYLKKDQRENQDKTLDQLLSYRLYTSYKDQLWTTKAQNTSVKDYEDGEYNWKITVEDLPQFDADGNEYGYVFRERMNNDGQTVLGTYISSEETKTSPDPSDTYEVFTNTITDYMTIQGKKTWTGLAGYQTAADDLPDPLITLYRTTDASVTNLQDKTDKQIQDLIDAKKITQVDTTHLTGSSADAKDKTRYAFSGKLPKFDAEGRRYTYLVRETLDKTSITNQLYNKVNTNGTLLNVFRSDINRRNICVTKTWAGRDNLKTGENKYPSVTYTLYRYEKDREAETLKRIASHTINANEFTGQNGEASYTFQDLLIYSPAGAQYCYYVVENAINGYTVTYTDEDGMTDESLKENMRIDIVKVPEKWNASDATQEDLTTSVGTTNTYNQEGNITISGEKLWNDYGNSEGLRPDKITLKLTRHTNSEAGQNNRVDATEVTLAEKEAEDKEYTEPYIVWSKEDNSNKWQYTIYNLERYAPNGMPYIYTLSEEQVTGYKKANDVSHGADSGSVKMANMTNQFDGTYYVRKNWMDGNNKYNLRPKDITVKLQRSTDGGNTWDDILWKEGFGTYDAQTGKWTGLPSVTSNEQGNAIVSVTLNATNVIRNTRNNSWEYTFTNLPTQDKAGHTYTYRCVETAIGGVPIQESTVEGQTGTKYAAGAYECRYTMQNASKTVIENTLNSTSLVVTKVWQQDQNNLYHTRPEKLTFKLQKRGIILRNETESDAGNTDSESQEGQLGNWEDVPDANGNPYTFTITPDKNGNWTTTLEDLPTVEVVTEEDGTTYTIYSLYFRAVEVHATDSDGKETVMADGAKNYQDMTDYGLNSNDHQYNKAMGRNESTITNQLRLDDPARTITVTKTWRRVPGESVTATFELLYKQESETDWHCYGKEENKELSVGDQTDWTKHTAGKGCLLKTVSSTDAGTSEAVSWTDLPKYDREGHLLEYKVIEHPIQGYATDLSAEKNKAYGDGSYATEYAFTNIELQSYTVKKIWQNTEDAEKSADGYTATFQLQQKIADEDKWSNVTGSDPVTLQTQNTNATLQHTWENLPKYTVDGKEITYRAVETQINGKQVLENTNGAYMVSSKYAADVNASQESLKDESSFQDAETVITNRMIYGFVNISKKAAYLAPNVTEGGSLAGVTFHIYKRAALGGNETLYASNVKTDAKGNLINDNGAYGDEKRYLAAGTYVLKEADSGADYSVWREGITFTIGKGDTNAAGALTDTGEHGTAWISTTGIGSTTLGLQVEYKAAISSEGTKITDHAYMDGCKSYNQGDAAVNLESRGVLTFTKTGKDGTALDTHTGADGESSAYFGVYLDKACTNQVAGLVPKATAVSGSTDKVTMVLTDKDQNGNVISEQKNANGTVYLRAYSSTSYENYPFTLLSGTYYIKELVAPAGYKLDTTVREAVIGKIASTEIDADLSSVYPSNQAAIKVLGSKEVGSKEYKWSNEPNVVTLYKLDQYGRQVPLKENGYLKLSIAGKTGEENVAFPSGEKVIRLYRKEEMPATKTDGTTPVSGISYDKTHGTWMLTGLLDINKTYTLSEPADSVHDHYIVANSISFQMQADGTIKILSNSATEKNEPLSATGTDYQNYYKANAANNQLVMRDVARYLKDVALRKTDSVTNTPIANISFKLYKYEGTPQNGTSVLKDDVYLTTDSKGKIDLKDQDEKIINQITGCALKYGLDIGTYYFEEVERGASDNYRLADKVFFEITQNQGSNITDYDDYAKVTYDMTDSHVQVSTDGKTVIVKNDPVSSNAKTLNLIKVDSQNPEAKLSGAEFLLTYVSINHGHEGSATTGDGKLSWTCKTDADGVLYLTGTNGTFLTDSKGDKQKPDISRKGTYTLTETKAPEGYMTRTDDKGNPVTLLTFEVNSENEITNVKYYKGTGNLVTEPDVSSDTAGEHTTLNVTVKNEKTKVSVAKRNDLEEAKKTCDQKSLNGELLAGATLEIYEGTDTTIADQKKATLSNNQSTWNWSLPDGSATGSGADLPEGILHENTIYTLHESESNTPTGYLPADDIYFKLSGTLTKDGTVISRLYVWNGKGKPSTVTENGWTETCNLKDHVLTMVDEAVIAPVDLQKVIEENSSYQALQGAVFEVKAGDTILGTAESTASGYLVWKEIKDAGYDAKLIFNEAGKRVTKSDAASVIGKSIILQQNADGYTFTEIYAPDQAYNDGRTYQVSITDANYLEYRTKTDTGYAYQSDKYINLVEAKKAQNHEAEHLATRGTDITYTEPTGLAVNLPYKSTVTLHKYDGDEEGQKAAISGTEFTLYRGSVSDQNIYRKAYSGETLKTDGIFTTDADGNLSIEIHEKGTYILKETKAATGYQLDEANIFTFVLTDKAVTENEMKVSYGYGESNALQRDTDGVPNQRIMGEVRLTKTDAKTSEKLNGVVYTLTRTDTPKDNQGNELFKYLLKKSIDVTTGKNYAAVKNVDTGEWSFTESDGDAGEIHITGLNWGSYTLTEKTELSGYVLEKDSNGKIKNTHFFTIDGKHETNGQNDQLQFEYADTNTRNSVTFYKTNMIDAEAGVTDQKDLKGLEGAVFEVHEGDGNGECTGACKKASFYTSDTNTGTKGMTVTTGADGKVTIYGLPTDTTENAQNPASPKTYHLVEVSAPKGYKLQTNQVVFTIDRQGNVQIKDSAAADKTVVMQDELIKIYIQKLGEDGTTKLKGAEFELTDTCSDNCDHKLANGTDHEEKISTAEDGKILIPIERLIGGHTYTLKETKAPDGYECTAVVTFHVQTDGTIDTITSTGGYKGTDGNGVCASVDTDRTTINIRDEKIRVKLQKIDEEDGKGLNGVTFTLTPYGESSFADIENTGLTYDAATKTYTFITAQQGEQQGMIVFPNGLLKHDNSYLLKEIAATGGYYLGNEMKSGIILDVGKDGTICIRRTVSGITIDCPVTAENHADGTCILTARNKKATSFELTKKVEGNMGDLSGTFKIKMTVYEPDGTLVGERTVDLKLNDTYNSITGFGTDAVNNAFGNDAIPVGATLVITEDNDLNYSAVVRIKDGSGTVISEENTGKGTVKVTLNTSEKVSIELVNTKDTILDVGIHLENQTPWAVISLMIPAIWLAYRYRRKRKKGGEMER